MKVVMIKNFDKTSVKKLYQRKIKNATAKIERLQRRMNKNLSNHALIKNIEMKQSRLKVDILILEKKIEIINLKYKKAS